MSFTQIGEVDGSTPNWRLANLGDRGVRRMVHPEEVLLFFNTRCARVYKNVLLKLFRPLN